jgi:hypothetical protein
MAHVVILISPGKHKNTEHRVALVEDDPYLAGDHQYTPEYLSNFDRLRWFGFKQTALDKAANMIEEGEAWPPYELTLPNTYYSYFK